MLLIVLISILVGIILFACLTKLAARVMQRTRVTWSTCFLFALLTALAIFMPAFLPNVAVAWHPAGTPALGVALVIVAGGWFFKGRARTVADLPFGFSRAAAMTALSVTFAVTPVIGAAYMAAEADRYAPSGPSDLAVEVVSLSPPDGSTLLAQEWIHVKFKYRYSQPTQSLRFWVKILDPAVEGNYVGHPYAVEPGTGIEERAAFLNSPGKVNTLSIVAKDETSKQIFRKDIPVNYTVVANPAVDALKDEGKGSRIVAVEFPDGKRATLRRGTFIQVNLDYEINTPKGLYPSVSPVTSCSHTYAAVTEEKLGKGSQDMGFTIGEKCQVSKVRVRLVNQVSQTVHEQLVDVDLRITD